MDHLGIIANVALEGTIPLYCPCANSSGVPTAPDSAPAYTILNAVTGEVLASGTLSSTDVSGCTGGRWGSETAAAVNGFASGNTYPVDYRYAISGQNRVLTGSIAVY